MTEPGVRALAGAITAERPAWREVVARAKELLDTEHVWLYRVRLRERWEVPVWAGGDELPDVHARFARALATGPREWAWFRPTCPLVSQRNRVVESVAGAAREAPGFFEASPVYRDVFAPLGLARHRQLRVLVCDGDRLRAWFGLLQPAAPTRRQADILAALVPAVQRRVADEATLDEAGGTAAALAVTMEELPGAAVLATRCGHVLHANAAARAGSRDEPAIADAIAGRASRWRAVPVDAATWLVMARAAGGGADRLTSAAARWRLTPRQRDVLACVIAGLSNAAIADELGVSTRAVELHVTALLDRAGVASRAGLVAAVYDA